MRYYKVRLGYGDGEVVQIDDTEIEKAMYAFITGSQVVLKGGAGKVINIVNDLHRAMGWNEGYKLGAEDHGEIRAKLGNTYVGALEETKRRIQYLISRHEEHLIGQNVPIPELEAMSEASKQLAANLSAKR